MYGSLGLRSRSFLIVLGLLSANCSALIDADPAKLAGGPAGNCSPACDDGIPCTKDECTSDNRCVFRPSAQACDDGVSCTEDICDPKRGCKHEARDDRCEFCAPGSKCDTKVGGCVGFTSQRNCSDDDPCTKDECLVADMMCSSSDVDEDGDGYGARTVKGESCGGKDCDDTRAGVFPGATEVCNGRDDDCNGTIDDGCMASPDTCESAVDVVLTEQGSGVLEGSFGQLEPDFDVSCGSSGAPDAVYHLEIKPDVADIVLEADSESAELVLAAGPTCGDAGLRAGCARPLARGGTRLVFHRFQGRDLFVLVDAKSKAESGDYRVKVSVTPAAADECTAMAFDHTGCGTLVGVMPAAVGQLLGGCQSGGFLVRGASEAVFRIVGSTQRMNLSARSDDFGPALYTRDGCSPLSSELSCDARPSGGEAKLTVEPGRDLVYAIVDGASPGDTYTLTCGP